MASALGRSSADQYQPSAADTQGLLTALAGETDVPASKPSTNQQPHPESPLAGKRSSGRVHWGGPDQEGLSSNSLAPTNRRIPQSSGRLSVGQASGPTVTVRSPSGGVVRPNHPGPLNLTSRLDDKAYNAAPAPMTAPPHEQAGQAEAAAAADAVPTLNLIGARGLDEEGLDNRAFLELQRELQRHEAHSETTSDAASWNGGRSTALEQALQNQAHIRAEQRRVRPRQAGHETPDWAAPSGPSTPGSASDTGSYDAAADSDLDHIEFMAGEVDGMPSKPRRKKGVEEDEPKGWSKLRSMLGKVKSPETDPEKRPYEAGGPTNLKSVPVTTSTGVHQGPRSRPNKFEREAAKLIRNHKLMTGVGRTSEDEGDSRPLDRMPSLSRRHLESDASTPDVMDTAAALDARPVTSGGVLGNLLKLYEQQQAQQEGRGGSSTAPSGLSTADATSVASTPDREQRNGLHSMVSEGLRAQNVKAAADGSAPVAPPAGAAGANRRPANVRTKSWAPSSDWAQNPSKIAAMTSQVGKKTLKVVANEAGFEDVTDERPKASRSSAGVVGGLIATTGNLIGAVSPYHAQLGPNPKRPGYTLDRYLLPELNAKTLKRTAEAVATAAPRPARRSQSQPGTPGIRSPNGGTIMGRKDYNASSETQAATPNEKQSKYASGGGLNTVQSRKGHILQLPGQAFQKWTGHSAVNTPDPGAHDANGDYFGNAEEDERLAKAEWQKKIKKRTRDKRRKEEIFITMHVAAILQRQEFLLKLSRALMMFGAPTHRIETQIQQTARVLEINCRCIYLPNLMLFAFGDDATHTSEIKFIKQAGGLDFTKLTDMHTVYWNVIHDKIGVGEAAAQLDELMRRKPLIGRWPMVLIGGFCSSFICVGPMGFNGSFIDAVMAWPLGAFLVYCQSIITQEIFSNVFEIVFAALNSFVAAAVSSTGIFCYAGVVSGSIVLILPGFIVLSGSLELQSKNLIAGSVRLVYAIIYSLFLGFGLSIGSSFWALFSGGDNDQSVSTCTDVHDSDIWYRSDVGLIWALLTVPMYSICLSLRNQAKVNRKEFPAMVLIACGGWACNHFASTAPALSGRQDITSALGSLAVGILSNIYGRFFDGRSYVVAVTGVLYQLPSGLSNGGLLNFAQTNNTGSDNFSSGFTVAESLVEVALGLTVGLFAATILAYAFGGRKQRRGGLFSF